MVSKRVWVLWGSRGGKQNVASVHLGFWKPAVFFFLLQENAGGDRSSNLATFWIAAGLAGGAAAVAVSLPGSLWLYLVLLQLSQKGHCPVVGPSWLAYISAISNQHRKPHLCSPWKSGLIDLQPKSAEKLEPTPGKIWELFKPQTFPTPVSPLLSESRVGGGGKRIQATR